MKILLSLLLSLSASLAFSYDCQLDQNLSAEQRDAIEQARQKRTKDWLGRVLSQNQNEYRVDVLYSKIFDKYLVLLGEFHIKGAKASKIGLKLVDQFQYRLFELVPPRESHRLGIADNPNEFISLRDALYSFTAITTGRWFDSTIFELLQKGLSFLPYQSNGVKHDNYTLRSDALISNLDVMTGLYQNYKLIKEQSELEYSYINLPLEVGPYLEPSEDDSYIIDGRNIRMVTNILLYYLYFVEDKAAVAVVGANHNVGMIDLLANAGEFVLCE
jgi:hypothetical protein